MYFIMTLLIPFRSSAISVSVHVISIWSTGFPGYSVAGSHVLRQAPEHLDILIEQDRNRLPLNLVRFNDVI
jgi:hypothetical protein